MGHLSLNRTEGRRVHTTAGPVPRFGSVLSLNAGRLHHVGPGRQWVELSRRWAEARIRCLRIDIGGVGESALVGPLGELSSYPPSTLDDVSAAVAFLEPDNPRDPVLLGLCSGSYHSLLAAFSTGVGGVAILNPLRLPSGPAGVTGSTGAPIDGVLDPTGSAVDRDHSTSTRPRHRILGSLRDGGALHLRARHIPDRVWWVTNMLGRSNRPVDGLQRVVDSGPLSASYSDRTNGQTWDVGMHTSSARWPGRGLLDHLGTDAGSRLSPRQRSV